MRKNTIPDKEGKRINRKNDGLVERYYTFYIGRLVSWVLVGRMAGRMAGWPGGWLVGWWVSKLIDWLARCWLTGL